MTLRDFEEALGGGWLRTIQLVQTALTLGPLVFLGVVVGLHLMGQPGDGGDAALLGTLSLVHGAMLLAVLPAAFVVPRLMLGRGGGAARDGSGPLAGASAYVTSWLRMVQATFILRMAMVEGAALFGTVVVLLAVLAGRVAEEPVWWLNALSTVVLVVVSVTTFPTRDRVLALCRHHALGR